MNFEEKINVSNAKRLLGLKDERLKEIIDPSGDKFQDGEELFKNIDTYIKSLKYWLIKAISQMNKKGYIEAKYQYSRKLKDCGRKYVKSFGIQKLKKNLRGYLIKDEVVDLDMVNAHPSILLNILENNFNGLGVSWKLLKKYVENREYYLNEDNISKEDILISMNSNKIINHSNKKMKVLDYEFKKIQKLIFNNSNKLNLSDRSQEVKEDLKQNKEGKFLNHILTVKENQILQKVMKKYKVQTPMFDGFTIDKNDFNENTINELNELTEEDGIKWSKKEHDESIEINDDEIEENDEYISYEEQKMKFEENHFMIENPIMYGRFYTIDNEEKYQLYGKDKFRELVKPIKFFNGEKKEFFPSWLEDSKRQSYKEVKFIPTNKKREDVFNSFTGFNYEDTNDFLDSKLIKLFKEHISILTNHEEKSIDYLIKFIAHLIQKPEERPETIILLKSNQGYGKDTLINIIVSLLGEKYFLRTAEIDDIFGSYNVGLRDKLFLQLNELEGKDGFSHKEKIKNLATEEKTIIREKYVSQYDQTNYLRIFICSNNFNPVEIPFDDRRMTVFQAQRKKPSFQYFKELNKYLKDKEELQKLFNYLNNIDISNFNPANDRPITKAYENMKESNQNPIYKYLYDNFIRGDYKNNFDKDHVKKQKKNNKLFIQSNVFYHYYKEYLSSEDLEYIKPTFKIVKSILLDLGIEKKAVKISGQNNDYYIIDTDDLNEALKNHNLGEEIEEYEEDDFE